MVKLQNLISEAQKNGGFYVFTDGNPNDCPLDGVNKLGYSIVAHSGFLEEARIKDLADWTIPHGEWKLRVMNFIAEIWGANPKPNPVNEIVIYKSPSKKTLQVGTKKTGWFSSEPVYKEFPIQTKEVLERGDSEHLATLAYLTLRKECDHVGRRDIQYSQFMYTNETLLNGILEELKKQPQRAHEIFQGVFPGIDEKCHPDKNGRIIIASEQDLISLVTPNEEGHYIRHRGWENDGSADRLKSIAVEYQI